MIAIALSCNPKLLIADEPTTALDVTVQAGVLDLLDELREEHDMAMIIITHDMGVVAETADDIVVMYAGQIVEQATVARSLRPPEHPYTEALLAALPQLEGEGMREALGSARSPAARRICSLRREACRFAPRCTYAEHGRLRHRAPELREIRPGHWVRSAHPASERAASRWCHDERERRASRGAAATVDGEPLLAVDELKKYFPIKQGVLVERTVDYVKAVDDVSLRDPHGGDARSRRRVAAPASRRPGTASSSC